MVTSLLGGDHQGFGRLAPALAGLRGDTEQVGGLGLEASGRELPGAGFQHLHGGRGHRRGVQAVADLVGCGEGAEWWRWGGDTSLGPSPCRPLHPKLLTAELTSSPGPTSQQGTSPLRAPRCSGHPRELVPASPRQSLFPRDPSAEHPSAAGPGCSPPTQDDAVGCCRRLPDEPHQGGPHFRKEEPHGGPGHCRGRGWSH